jgi:hypothetical protein
MHGKEPETIPGKVAGMAVAFSLMLPAIPVLLALHHIPIVGHLATHGTQHVVGAIAGTTGQGVDVVWKGLRRLFS